MQIVLLVISILLIIIVLLMPVLSNFAAMVGIAPGVLIMLLFIVAHLALATPAAAPPTGICFTATEIVKFGDMVKYSLICLPFLFIFTLAVGYPYALLIL